MQTIPDPALAAFGVQLLVQLSLQAQVMGLRAWQAGPVGEEGWGVPVEGQLPSRQRLAVSAHGAAPQTNS